MHLYLKTSVIMVVLVLERQMLSKVVLGKKKKVKNHWIKVSNQKWMTTFMGEMLLKQA